MAETNIYKIKIGDHTYNLPFAKSDHTHTSLVGLTEGITDYTENGLRYSRRVSSNIVNFGTNNNANAVITTNTHDGNYFTQIGISTPYNRLYVRSFNGAALDSTSAWATIAYTSEIPWYGYTNDIATNNTTDTWVPVLTDKTIQHRVIPIAYNNAPSTLSVKYADSAGSAKRCSTKQSSSSNSSIKYYKVSGLIENTSNRQSTYIITTRWNENYYVSIGTCDGSNDKLPQITRIHNSYGKIEGFSYKSGVLYIKSAAYNNTIGIANITNLSDTTITIEDSTSTEFNTGTVVPIWTNLNSDNCTTYCSAVDHTHSNYLTGITKTMVTNALGYTPPTTDTNTWRGITDTYNTSDPSSSVSLSQAGAKALYDSVKYKQYYSIDLKSLSTSNFYPVYFNASDMETDCEIHSPNQSGSAAYNQNHIHFLLTAQGWSDTAKRFIVLSQGNYDDSEVTIGAIGYGNREGAQCIWLRGGLLYRMWCNKTPLWNGSNVTYGGEVYTVGTNYDGGSNTHVTILWKFGESSRNDTQVATRGDIPTKTSQLTNDSGFLTSLPSHTHNYIPTGGGVAIGSSSARYTNAYFSGSVSAKGGFYEDSDERLKDIIKPLSTDLNKLSELKKVYYKFKDEDKENIGVIAQDIKSIYPEIVNEDESGYLSVDYSKLSVIALDAVDQLHTELNEVKEKLNKVLQALNL